MKKVIKYVAEDGTIYDTEQEAVNRDQFSELADWYDQHMLYGSSDGSRIEWKDLIEWMGDNEREIKSILKLL